MGAEEQLPSQAEGLHRSGGFHLLGVHVQVFVFLSAQLLHPHFFHTSPNLASVPSAIRPSLADPTVSTDQFLSTDHYLSTDSDSDLAAILCYNCVPMHARS